MEKGRVFVGLSGGVDSAVAASLLLEQGYEVVGVFIRIALPGYPCSAGEDKVWAMRAAASLRIPFREVDLSDEYKKRVFDLSMREFRAGRTPNPDALCNREIKFGIFFQWCMKEGADFVATGHYARTKDGLLYMGADKKKDQSYFLWAVPRETLSRTLFPLGDMRKPEVRARAAKIGLPNASRKDSQGLCFLGDVSIEDMLRREVELRPGAVLDEEGRAVGKHEGAPAYTLGQRHGFSLSASSPSTLPHFVVAKDAKANTITVSVNRAPRGTETLVQLEETNWIGESEKTGFQARFRYRGALIPAERRLNDVLLNEPLAIPEGQSLVLYQGERCLGGGIIARARTC